MAVALTIAACEPAMDPVDEGAVISDEAAPQFKQSKAEVLDAYAGPHEIDPVAVARITDMVDRFNARLHERGVDARLDYPWFFMVGGGTDPWNRLRTGARWPQSPVSYVLRDRYTADLPPAVTEATLVSAYDTWTDVRNTYIEAQRIDDPAPALNTDILDGTFVDGQCVDLIDQAADNIISYDPQTGDLVFVPIADIVVGGWLGLDYFVGCLGSEFIIGVTWSFSVGDANMDNYVDQLYVEQYYNDFFNWVTSGAVFFGNDIDLETIALHENGHTHGLGHFGGPLPNQKLLLRRNGRLYTPEAVMNPVYFGGEKRSPFPTDLAGLRALYGGPH